MQLLLFGYAINTDVRHIPTVSSTRIAAPQSRDLVAPPGGDRLLRRGRRRARLRRDRARDALGATREVALVIPPRYRLRPRRAGVPPQRAARRRRLRSADRRQRHQHRGRRWSAARSAELSASAPARGQRRAIARRSSSSRPPGTTPSCAPRSTSCPGLVGVILTMTMVMLTAMAHRARARARHARAADRLAGAAASSWWSARSCPTSCIGYVQMTLVLLVGRLVFGVPIVGSLRAALRARARCSSPRIWRSGCSSRPLAQTQQQAMQMSFFFLLPNILLSGFMFPFEACRCPRSGSSQALPLTHFLRIVRGITLKGAGFADLAPELVWLRRICSPCWCCSPRCASARSSADDVRRPPQRHRRRASSHAARARFLLDGVDGASLRAIAARRRHQHRHGLLLLPDQGRAVPGGGRDRVPRLAGRLLRGARQRRHSRAAACAPVPADRAPG